MRFIRQKFTILRMRMPAKSNINEDLQWLGSSLGLFSLRDKDKSCFRIFIELLKTTKQKRPISSDELAERLNLTRGTIVFHINKLANTGIVIKKDNRYLLRVDNLKELINEIEADIDTTLRNLKEVAGKIDKVLGE